MIEIKDLYDAGLVADEALSALNRAVSALTVTIESMDDDGIHPMETENPALALNFVARLPMYSDTLHLILLNMMDSLASLRTGTEAIFEAHKKQMATKETA